MNAKQNDSCSHPQKDQKLYFMYAKSVVGDLTTIKVQKKVKVQIKFLIV